MVRRQGVDGDMWSRLGACLRFFCKAALQPQCFKVLLWMVIAVLFSAVWWRGRHAGKSLKEIRNEVTNRAGVGRTTGGELVIMPNVQRGLEMLAAAVEEVSTLSGVAAILSAVAAIISAIL